MESIYTVAKLNAYIRNMFNQDYLLSSVSVRGEISNCTYHKKGHIYFTLKDKLSIISCVMWDSNRHGLSFDLKEGQQVVVRGGVSTYEAAGKYQLVARKITMEGQGELYLRFLALKEELQERGMFDPIYKQPIPRFIRRLGVATAPTGAAIRDIISVAKGRDPYIDILLYPSLVQGEGAAADIVKGIKALEKQDIDLIIVGRGGGSLEDLWAFNEEEVAQAIFDCPLPIISAVGHETDYTIADFVADARAETPTAAAVMGSMDIRKMQVDITSMHQALNHKIATKIRLLRFLVDSRNLKLQAMSPESRLQNMKQFLDMHSKRLHIAMDNSIKEVRHRLSYLGASLEGMSPVAKLSQGYSYTENMRGESIRDASKVEIGENIKITLHRGTLLATVSGKDE